MSARGTLGACPGDPGQMSWPGRSGRPRARRTKRPPPRARARARARWPRGCPRRSRRSHRRRRRRRETSPRPRRRARGGDRSCGGYSAHMADFRPVEANKGHILMIRPAAVGTAIQDANAEWVEILADLSSDLANWRLQHLRGLWKPEVAKPVEWEWIYTWGSPSFVRAGEIYRIHSGSGERATPTPGQAPPRLRLARSGESPCDRARASESRLPGQSLQFPASPALSSFRLSRQ